MRATALRLVTDARAAELVHLEPLVDARAILAGPAASGPAMIRTALSSDVDAALVRAEARGAVVTAVALRAAGVSVWWIDDRRTSCPGLGAPAVSSARPDLAGFERIAELASRPGAGLAGGPAVSVVVTTLNEGAGLDRLVSGVVAQLRGDDEIVVVDGGSSDGSTQRVSAAWAGDVRVRLETAPGAGISAGRNAGVRLAAHDVIACTDAGCDLDPGWLEGMRRAFAVPDRPGLVSGPYRPTGRGPLARAQALACYPDPYEVARPDLLVSAYTRLFGTRFQPEYAIGRNVAFTREAWEDAGGFPEHLPTGEDVSFGLAVARTHRCVGTSDAQVSWDQRPDLRATWRMYCSYGRASTDGGDVRLLARDAARGGAYLGALALVAAGRGRRAVAIGCIAYLSLPVRRARRAHCPAEVYPLLPLAMATKDLGKLTGAVQGFARARRRRS